MACCVGARLVNSILKALNMPDLKVTLWFDSTTALWWIKEYGNWSVFVANRVKEIRQLTQIQSWKYVPGNMNIADLLSRGCSPRQMLNSKWWEGPSWLKQNSEYWPDGEISCEPQEVNVERKKTKNANVDLANDAPSLLLCNVSDYDKMIRVFTWILRFVNNCRKDYKKCKEHELSVAEIENSEKQLIRLSQTYYLPDVESLKFVTFIDNDNILRVKSKITERNDESSFLYPILLPDKCEFTKLLIRSIHKKNCHAGIQIMQSLIRERFWIIRARKTIKSILNECFICARFKVKSLSSGPSPLPPDRVNDCAIFEVVGIDLAGPLCF
ncbi:integrase catalytic domain-containing protein [Trichonephila clavipes]|nr:integrase catalytic domain-containing protein [Trichonephila clavipes]